jgi:hypothetical protein
MRVPRQTKIEQDDTHRLIPYRYSDRGKPILNLIAENDDDLLTDLIELEGATNDRLLGESGKIPGISAIELVSGFPLAHIVNATFTHANPLGGRFNSPTRGVWYAAFILEVAQAEIAFHRGIELKEVNWREKEIFEYVDYLADFRHEFHDIRGDSTFTECLNPDSYAASQVIGLSLLNIGSAGVVYPSVRGKGDCIACFRPPLVLNVREGKKVIFVFADAKLNAVQN